MNKVLILVSVIGMCSAYFLPILSGGLSSISGTIGGAAGGAQGGIGQAIGGATQAASTIGAAAGNLINEDIKFKTGLAQGSISGTIGGAAGGAQGGIGQAIGGATQAASTIGAAAGNLINEDIKFKTGLAQGALNAGSDILAAKSAFVGKLANAAEGAISGGLGGVTNATGAVGGAVGDLINDEIRIKSGLAQGALGGVQDLLKAKGDFVGQVGGAVGDAVNKGVSGIGQTAGTIGGAVGNLINDDIKFKTRLAQGALNAGSDILAAKGAFIGKLANAAEGAVSGGLGGAGGIGGGFVLPTIGFVCLCYSDPTVSGRCGPPGLPPKAKLQHISPERISFDNNEKVVISCKKDEFPQFNQELECRNGEHVDTQVTHLDVFDCQSPDNRLLLSQAINKSWVAPPDLPLQPNSYHLYRVPFDLTIPANESTCYTWRIHFEHNVSIAFLRIDFMYSQHNSTGSQTNVIENVITNVEPIVSPYRTCILQENILTMGHHEMTGRRLWTGLQF
ncbi:unnamed protein product [Oppiella nova]|uniref:Uncharacterized protein n=1 Tax=Oppiella nova TaxID=334625 RepID=A0A7R9QRV9_9ACAR|nr:unnamed protein product [Oppiella nova]CAG2171657.1 unnamed protein product [Oppiella nova]